MNTTTPPPPLAPPPSSSSSNPPVPPPSSSLSQEQQQRKIKFKRPTPINTSRRLSSSSTTVRRTAASTATSSSSSGRRRKRQHRNIQERYLHTAIPKEKFDERQFILRLPEHVAAALRTAISVQDKSMRKMKKKNRRKRKSSMGGENHHDDSDSSSVDTPLSSASNFDFGGTFGLPIEGMKIEFYEDDPLAREGRLILPDSILQIAESQSGVKLRSEYAFELVDLPAIVEAYKSLDMMTYYKSGDVGQMFLVKDESPRPVSSSGFGTSSSGVKKETSRNGMRGESGIKTSRGKSEVDDDPDEQERREYYEMEKKLEKYQYPHGLTPSLRDIRKSWLSQEMNVTRKDIDRLVQEFERMMEEEDQANVEIEIFSEDDTDYDDDEELLDDSISVTTTDIAADDVSVDRSTTPTETKKTPDASVTSTLSATSSEVREGQAGRARTFSEMEDDGLSEISDESSSFGAQFMRAMQGLGDEEVSMSSFGDEPISETTTTATDALDDVSSPIDTSTAEREADRRREYQNLVSEKSGMELQINGLVAKIDEARSNLERAPHPQIKARYQKTLDDLQAQLHEKQSQLQAIDARIRELRG